MLLAMMRRVIAPVLVLFALFAWSSPPESAGIPREPPATTGDQGLQSYPYDGAVDLGLIQPRQQKLPWCTGRVPGYGSFMEADTHALDLPVCQVNPQGSTVFIGDLLSKPSDSP